MVKSAAVRTAPTVTSRQRSRTSGSTLNISANSTVITPNDTRLFTASQSWVAVFTSVLATYACSASMSVETTSDTRSRKQIAITIAKLSSRWRTKSQTAARPGLGATSQMVLSESCSSAKTLVAPKSSTSSETSHVSGPGRDGDGADAGAGVVSGAGETDCVVAGSVAGSVVGAVVAWPVTTASGFC